MTSVNEQEPILEIVIVAGDGEDGHVRVCLVSLRRFPLTRGPMAVAVVDNGSGGRVSKVVREECPEARLYTVERNVGFPRANNLALRDAKAELVLVLNPDTEFVEDSLDYLVDLMRERPDVGVSGCRLVRRDGSFDHAAKRAFPTPVAAFAHFTGLGRRREASPRLAQYRAPEVDERGAGEVDSVNGAFMLVRRSAMDEVGLFDEGYWLYMEDLDWCYRFKQAGWKVWYDGGTTVIHVKGGGTVTRGHRRLRQNYAFHRSMARFYRKFYAGKNPLLDAGIYAAIATKFGVSATRSAIARRSIR